MVGKHLRAIDPATDSHPPGCCLPPHPPLAGIALEPCPVRESVAPPNDEASTDRPPTTNAVPPRRTPSVQAQANTVTLRREATRLPILATVAVLLYRDPFEARKSGSNMTSIAVEGRHTN